MEVLIEHTCSVCQCAFTDDEGGIDGYFGMLPVQFCPTCFSCMCDMASQYIMPDEEENLEHNKLIEHLRGLRNVVINTQHGGFSLSYDAKIAYLERAGIVYKLEDRESRDDTVRRGPYIKVNGKHWTDCSIPRDDPALVEVVRELKKYANGEHADLKIVQIPSDVLWVIEDYDGNEWISEEHRTWN